MGEQHTSLESIQLHESTQAADTWQQKTSKFTKRILIPLLFLGGGVALTAGGIHGIQDISHNLLSQANEFKQIHPYGDFYTPGTGKIDYFQWSDQYKYFIKGVVPPEAIAQGITNAVLGGMEIATGVLLSIASAVKLGKGIKKERKERQGS